METKELQEREHLLSWSMLRLFKKLAIPGMMGMVLIGLCNLMDAVFVGHLISKEAVGAVALVYSIVALNLGFCLLIGSGSMSMLSIAMGKKDQATIDKLLGNMIASIFILSGAFSIFVYFNVEWIVPFIGGDGLVAELAVRYLRVISIGMIFGALGIAMNFLLRGEGKMKIAMCFAGGASLLNIILNPIFISVFDMGIEGAAVATIISKAVYVLGQLLFFSKGNSVIALRKAKIKLEKTVLPKVLKVGLSQLMMMIMATVQQILLFRGLQYYGGSEHVVLMGASYRAFMFAFIAIWGIAQGMQPVIGVNYGAGRLAHVKMAFNSFTLLGLIVTSVSWLFFMLFPDLVLSAFITDPDVVMNGVPFFRILHIVFFGYIYFATLLSLCMGLGKAKESGALIALRQILLFIPLVLILPRIFGVIGVWIAFPLADFLTMVFAGILHRRLFISDEFVKFNPKSVSETGL